MKDQRKIRKLFLWRSEWICFGNIKQAVVFAVQHASFSIIPHVNQNRFDMAVWMKLVTILEFSWQHVSQFTRCYGWFPAQFTRKFILHINEFTENQDSSELSIVKFLNLLRHQRFITKRKHQNANIVASCQQTTTKQEVVTALLLSSVSDKFWENHTSVEIFEIGKVLWFSSFTWSSKSVISVLLAFCLAGLEFSSCFLSLHNCLLCLQKNSEILFAWGRLRCLRSLAGEIMGRRGRFALNSSSFNLLGIYTQSATISIFHDVTSAHISSFHQFQLSRDSSEAERTINRKVFDFFPICLVFNFEPKFDHYFGICWRTSDGKSSVSKQCG